MRRKITIATLVVAALVACQPASAMQNKVGTAGALFLKIGMDVRSSAMGEALSLIHI